MAQVNYLTGAFGKVTITPSGGTLVNVHITKWEYEETVEVVKRRAGGDGAYARDPLAIDWNAPVEGLIKKGEAGPNARLFNGLNGTTFALQTDAGGTPHLEVSGSGMITNWKYGVPVEDSVTVTFKLECDSADVANLPTIAPAV